MTRQQILQRIDKLDAELMDLILEHWIRFGHFLTWQFWFNVIFFSLPLIITFIFIDRKKIFQIAFYGYSFHVLFVYLDVFFTRFNFWDHPYLMIPFIPVSIPVDASLVPVTFMLAYQFSINRNKNFFLVTLITSFLVTLIAWGWQQLDLLVLYKGMNLFHIFLLDVGMALIAYWFTNLFLRLQKNM